MNLTTHGARSRTTSLACLAGATLLLATVGAGSSLGCGSNDAATGTTGTGGGATGGPSSSSTSDGGASSTSSTSASTSGGGSSTTIDVIPKERLIDWTKAGVPGGIPARTHLIDVTKAPYNADATGANDATGPIQDAVQASVDGDVIYLPTGKYRLDGTVTVGFLNGHPDKSNITLRGDGQDKTIIDCRAGRCFEVGSEADYLWNYPSSGNVITGGLTKGSTELTVADTSAFEVGKMVQIQFEDDLALPVVHVASFHGTRRQKSRVTAKTATTLTIDPPVYGDFTSTPASVFTATHQSDLVGIEAMTIDGSNGMPQFGVLFTTTYGSWVKDVKIVHMANYSLYLLDSLNAELRHSYFDELNHSGSNGAGILVEGTAASRVEDNIIYKSFPHIEINNGSAGNVFAYNFAEQNDVFGIMGASIDSNHGPHNAYNLFEGNVASVFESDGYFGSDSEETIFRNWFHATCDTTNQFGRAIQINRFSRNFSIVGNVLGRTGFPFLYDNAGGSGSYDNRYAYLVGLPNIGNEGFNGSFAQLSKGMPWADWATAQSAPPGSGPGASGFQELDLDVGATAILKGNWNAADAAVPAKESLGQSTLPNSLYLTSKPAWFGSLAWPAFDPASPNQSYEAIPAGYRYVHGKDPM